MNSVDEPNPSFSRKAIIVVGLVTATVVTLLLLWEIVDVLILGFAGLLLGVLLRWLSEGLQKRVPFSYQHCVVVVLIVLLIISGVAGWLAAPQLVRQANLLTDSLARSTEALVDRLGTYPWSEELWEQAQGLTDLLAQQGNFFSQVSSIFSTTLGALTNLILLVFIGLYYAFDPGLYQSGLIRLVPQSRRSRAREVLAAVSHTLRYWLLGRLISMVIVGVLTAIGLWILGIPLAFILGVLAALLAFIPYIGAVLSLLPAFLLAFTISPEMAIYVTLVYAGIQLVESYLLTPLVQMRVVSLPPILTIMAQVVLGLLFGFLGVALASPLAAAGMVLVKMIYIEDVLGDHSIAPLQKA
ncbi:MAG: AI-2E family transporter [Candidatus Promineifilaceae bacterium]|nr:AI-2E family transporter [Candidatus Promineifilaceae bacterium]